MSPWVQRLDTGFNISREGTMKQLVVIFNPSPFLDEVFVLTARKKLKTQDPNYQ